MRDRTVLVVEGDAEISALLFELLEDAGYAVLHAARGHQGLCLAKQHAPSVVLVNHLLPDMSGLDLLEGLRGCRATRHVPVVLVSGARREFDRDGSTTCRVLPMPFDIDDLLTHVEQLALSNLQPVA